MCLLERKCDDGRSNANCNDFTGRFITLKKIKAEWKQAKTTIAGTAATAVILSGSFAGLYVLLPDMVQHWKTFSLIDKGMEIWGLGCLAMSTCAGALTWRETKKQAEQYIAQKNLSEKKKRSLKATGHAINGAFYIYSINLACWLMNNTTPSEPGIERIVANTSTRAAFWGSLGFAAYSIWSIGRELLRRPKPPIRKATVAFPLRFYRNLGPGPHDTIH